MTSGPSKLNFGADGFQLSSSVFDFHLPIDASLRFVHVFDHALISAAISHRLT